MSSKEVPGAEYRQTNLATDPQEYKFWAEVSSWLYDAVDNVDVSFFPTWD